MNTVYLNGDYMPMEAAQISPLDRGFLFGDGIYEVIPAYNNQLLGFTPHIERMNAGLKAIGIPLQWSIEACRAIAQTLIEQNGGGNLGVYLQVSRGADTQRAHAFPEGVTPTVFAFTFKLPAPQAVDKNQAKGYKVTTAQDQRWKNCHIKSTSLLGNVLHVQQGVAQGYHETLLYNADNALTEAGACNVYIVKNGVVITPPLDQQILPGVTRYILLDILRKDGTITVEERVVSMDEVFNADEVWLTSSTKDIAPVIEIDGVPVGEGKVGALWQAAQGLYRASRFDY